MCAVLFLSLSPVTLSHGEVRLNVNLGLSRSFYQQNDLFSLFECPEATESWCLSQPTLLSRLTAPGLTCS